MADGADSLLDADTLDGFDSGDFVRTAEQVLGRLRTVDGAGSGVDADRLDGIDSSQFVRTAAQVLARLLEVDGANSGIDADRLDGLDSAQFARAAEITAAPFSHAYSPSTVRTRGLMQTAWMVSTAPSFYALHNRCLQHCALWMVPVPVWTLTV